MTDRFPEAAYCVLDIETTGLVAAEDDILQIAWALLDTGMRPLPSAPAYGALWLATERLPPTWGACRFHTTSGLLERWSVAEGKLPRGVAETVLSSLVPQGCILVGNQVENFDRVFLKVHMPILEKKFSHNTINVSSIRDVYCQVRGISRHKARETFGFNHDAYGDVCSCIKELNFYRSIFAK